MFHIVLRRCKTHPVCLSCSAESATEAISLALSCTERLFHIALRRCETLWSAREVASIAPSAEQARHADNVFHIALRRCETHPVCFSCSAESATEAISLALSCTERLFHIALR